MLFYLININFEFHKQEVFQVSSDRLLRTITTLLEKKTMRSVETFYYISLSSYCSESVSYSFINQKVFLFPKYNNFEVYKYEIFQVPSDRLSCFYNLSHEYFHLGHPVDLLHVSSEALGHLQGSLALVFYAFLLFLAFVGQAQQLGCYFFFCVINIFKFTT